VREELTKTKREISEIKENEKRMRKAMEEMMANKEEKHSEGSRRRENMKISLHMKSF